MEINSNPSLSAFSPRLSKLDPSVDLEAENQNLEESAPTQGATGEAEETSGGEDKQNSFAAQLTPEEKKVVEKLKVRDREVRAHEQAHKAVAGAFVIGGPSFDFQRGPDNRLYAVGGEVRLDTSEVQNNPQATITKAQTLRRAALAPAEPSGQDLQVAAQASAMEVKARKELAEERTEETEERTEASASSGEKNQTSNNVEETGPSANSQRPESAPGQNKPDLSLARKIGQFSGDSIAETGNLLDLFT